MVGVVLDGTYTGEGVKVADEGGVASGGPADLAGIESGDVITAIDGRPITRSDELVVAIRAKAPDEDVVLTVRRGESEQDITVTLVANTEVSYGDSGEPEESAPEQSGPDGDGGMLPDPSE
ncbi:PDZ domain-containing protein [Demequina sediminis]|uniref:PDZ domain-containing protein n=1 Tax=Demequina sediminis TaxID=1930058 RepID=UPI0033059060